jgi:hypothetical protein
MKPDEWKMFSGWCGHQHVPNNDHTDPGAIDIDSLMDKITNNSLIEGL